VRSILWLVIIAFSLCALAGGFFSGSAAVPRISLHFPSPDPIVSTAPLDIRPIRGLEVPQTDEMALDDFVGDPAVVSGATTGDIQHEAHLALVFVGCGHSLALETPFLALDIPLAVVIEPDGPAAHAIADAAAAAGKTAFVQMTPPLTATQIDAAHADFPHALGVAARFEHAPAPDVLRAMRRQRFAVLDEFGDVSHVRKVVQSAGIVYVSRTITIDDHLQPSYVQYMLEEAVHLGRGSAAVVMARPLPGTLHALQALITSAPRDGVAFQAALR
jgi:polysaccharide deacetylase 2 family uncharacterized protein YibQ